jgi:TRAP-type C4-dicarboxylate transport system permease small subunit
MIERFRDGVPWAGLAAGAGAWALSTQLNYVFATVHCDALAWLRAVTAIACLVIAAVGLALTWPAWRRMHGDLLEEDVIGPHPRRLVAGVSILAATLFGLAILLQTAGVLILGCKQ